MQWYKSNDSFDACGRYSGALRSYFACGICALVKGKKLATNNFYRVSLANSAQEVVNDWWVQQLDEWYQKEKQRGCIINSLWQVGGEKIQKKKVMRKTWIIWIIEWRI